ncbi:hypothetical protein GGX14DRAFT_480402 [Mycena pura]|uniref:C2H2-type domain-containing protein n=1 Tax=Mycena pura TaxID=153505 RepID=A0AAD6URM8_9AGAR|nr:hypothetical protein GGX14DRAFT_480402 [Mycena pura]
MQQQRVTQGTPFSLCSLDATVAPRVLTPEPSCANHGPIDDVLSKEVDRLARTLKLDPADRWKITPTRAEPQALYTCPWPNCGAQIGGTIEQINHHFRLLCFGRDLMGESHHDVIPVGCAFPGCDKTVAFKAIARHLAGVHFNSLAIRCPFPGCGTILSRESNYQDHYMRHIRDAPGAPARRGGAKGKQPEVVDLTSD